jgi:c-di-GMP-binding flagellar brake protein YcgR
MVTWTTPGRFREHHHTVIGSIVDLSATGAGIMVESDRVIEVGAVVRLGLTGWAATAHVRHVLLNGINGARHYGVEFSQVDAEFREFVEQYLAAFLGAGDPGGPAR